ncbi:MAG: hypothetical protein Q9218_007182 [Villophora microphyllina]
MAAFPPVEGRDTRHSAPLRATFQPFWFVMMDITRFVVSQRDKALLIGDYGSYRKQLSRRLLVVRKKLNYSSKGRKYTPKAPVTAEDIANNHEFVHLLLLSAERAWALGMHMRSTHTADGSRGVTGSTKRHIASKLQRAIKYATHLVNLLQEKEKSGALSKSLLEARAYQQSLRGAFAFEKRHWEQCLRSYSEARLLYTALAQSAGTKQDDLFRDLLSSRIDQSIRYAAHQLQLPRTISIETIVARHVQRADNVYVSQVLQITPNLLQEPGTTAGKFATGKSEDVPKTIKWRSRTVELGDADTAQALASVAAAQARLESFLSADRNSNRRAGAAAYDDVLLPSQDAVDATKTAIDELTAEGVAQGDPRMQALQITRTAVNYNLVEWRVGRNRMLCGEHDGATFESETIGKPKKQRADGEPRVAQEESNGRRLTRLKERVALYDSTIQSLESVKDFPGVAADQAFVSELEAKKAYFSSLRWVVSSVRSGLELTTADVWQLLALTPCMFTVERATKLEIRPEQARFLNDILERSVLQYRALVELEDLNTAKSKETSNKPLPLIERLDEYPSNGVDLTNLVTYPPKVQPVPVKPIFLDVAWNYIDYPGRPKKGAGHAVDGKTKDEAPKPESKKEAKKGWFGFGRS